MQFKAIIVLCYIVYLSPIQAMDFFCFDAPSLLLQSRVCSPTFTQINFNGISTTTGSINACNMSQPDLYVHVRIPASTTGNFMVRRREGTSIEAQAEIYYLPNCLPSSPSGCCFSASLLVGCYDLETFPNAIIFENQAPGDYYIKIWDRNGVTSGTLNISAHKLPQDIEDWVLCDDESGEGTGFVANQLIIEPGPDFDPGIFNPGFREVKSCDCADPPLLLYEADDFATFLEGQITAKNATCVEGTGLNYIMETTRESFESVCDGSFFCSSIKKYKPTNPTTTARVAIVDTGINLDHDAFTNALWRNMEENDTDNCVLDDLNGYDFKNELGPPTDTDGHGSWVAGTVVEDFPEDIQLEIMSAKFFDDNNGTLFEALCGMHYAIDEGASTVVTSWGFQSMTLPPFLQDVFTKGQNRDVLFIASAGNTSDNIDVDIPKYPSNMTDKNLITVAGYDEESMTLASYSNYGPISVDLAAIGHIIAPSIFNNASSVTEVDSVVGTSIAAPRVARTAAIMKSYHPTMTFTDIKDCILNTATQHSALNGLMVSEGFLNHNAALACAAQKAIDLICTDNLLAITGHLINDAAYSTQATIHANAYVETGTTIQFAALEGIQLRLDFEVELGATFEALIQDCQ